MTRDVVRRAETSDAPELARLRWASRAGPASSRAAFVAECTSWAAQALASERWIVAVAGEVGRPLHGCIYLQLVQKMPTPGSSQREWGQITGAYVAAHARSNGLGTALLDLLVTAARERRLEFLIVWPSERSVPFYERLGFRATDDLHSRPGDYPPLELEL